MPSSYLQPRFLTRYFASGWAFLVPYVGAYAVFWWLRWPVNPSPDGSLSLLHVYWLLHVLHLLGGIIALTSYWRVHRAADADRSFPLFWLCLALLFFVPGLYLEYPSDTWEHLARINEWSWHETVVQHSSWTKSSYFLIYSLVGTTGNPGQQFPLLGLYYTGVCLLLCWQYFRLALAAGLTRQLAALFVLLQAALQGNNLFGFYRYYGLSSSLFCQIAVVALIRVLLTAAQATPGQPGREAGPGWMRLMVSAASLLALIVFNHIQGLGMVLFAFAGIMGWRLTTSRRAMAGWLALATVIASVIVIMFWPQPSAIHAVYRPQQWLTWWYGFDLFSPSSPAWHRAASIIGLPGLINLVAGIALMRRNHPVAWLTLSPVVCLCLPVFAVPIASALALRDVSNIIMLDRFLLGIPVGLALITLLGQWQTWRTGVKAYKLADGHAYWMNASLAGILALCVIPADRPYFNRLWHGLAVTTGDLQMKPVIHQAAAMRATLPVALPAESLPLLAAPGPVYVVNAINSRWNPVPRPKALYGSIDWVRSRRPDLPSTVRLSTLLREVTYASNRPFPTLLVIPPWNELVSPASLAGKMSRHWAPQFVALEYAGQAELTVAARARQARPSGTGFFLLEDLGPP